MSISQLLLTCLMVSSLSAAGGTTTIISSNDIAMGSDKMVTEMDRIRMIIGNRISDVIMAQDAKGWKVVLGLLANHYIDAAKLYSISWMSAMDVGEKLFEGNHTLQNVSRCSSLSGVVNAGNSQDLALVEMAIVKDMFCFSDMLKDIQRLKVHASISCSLTEDSALDTVALTIKHLFRLGQDGAQFLESLEHLTVANAASIPTMRETFDTEIEARSNLKDQLMRISKA